MSLKSILNNEILVRKRKYIWKLTLQKNVPFVFCYYIMYGIVVSNYLLIYNYLLLPIYLFDFIIIKLINKSLCCNILYKIKV